MEGEQLEDRRNVGESSCNSGDGTDERFQSLMFMMMMYSSIIYTSPQYEIFSTVPLILASHKNSSQHPFLCLFPKM